MLDMVSNIMMQLVAQHAISGAFNYTDDLHRGELFSVDYLTFFKLILFGSFTMQ